MSLRPIGAVLVLAAALAGTACDPSGEVGYSGNVRVPGEGDPPGDSSPLGIRDPSPTSAYSQGALVDINGTRLFIRRLGSGEPVVVVHGGPLLEHGYLLRHLAPLAQTHELIFFDQRLSGRSAGIVDSSTVRVRTFVEDIEGVRRSLGLGRIHLVAHSWGGLLAMHYALAHQEELRSLTLLNPVSASSTLRQEEERMLAERATPDDSVARAAILESEAFAEGRPDAIRDLLVSSFRTQFHDPALAVGLDLYVPDDYLARSRQFAHMMVDLAEFNLHPDLATLAVPTLILYGAAEPGAEIGGRELAKSIPGSRLEIMEETGHFPFIERPDAFLSIVGDFLGMGR